ncbi:MAG: hypothetical protein MHM6MM_003602, partial [Cercozoa sp. M6MM]
GAALRVSATSVVCNVALRSSERLLRFLYPLYPPSLSHSHRTLHDGFKKKGADDLLLEDPRGVLQMYANVLNIPQWMSKAAAYCGGRHGDVLLGRLQHTAARLQSQVEEACRRAGINPSSCFDSTVSQSQQSHPTLSQRSGSQRRDHRRLRPTNSSGSLASFH